MSALLEHHDELGMPWDDWADGRTYCLARGRDFFRRTELVQEAARNAARRLGKDVVTMRESRLGRMFLWVQFVDHAVEQDAPCACGSEELRMLNRQQAECASCGATITFLKPKRSKRVGLDDDVDAESPANATLEQLLRGPATVVASTGLEEPRVSVEELHGLALRAEATTSAQELRQWRRRSFNDVAGIVAAAIYSSDLLPATTFSVDEEVVIALLLETQQKAVDALCGIVVGDPEVGNLYRLVQEHSLRVGRPGRHVFSVTVPPATFAAGEYVARASVALVHDGVYSRITRRRAFSFEVHDGNGQLSRPSAADIAAGGLSVPRLEWTAAPGDGPWAPGNTTSAAPDG